VQNRTYKLCDTTYNFFNIIKDPLQLNPIPEDSLTSDQVAIKNKFAHILNTMQ